MNDPNKAISVNLSSLLSLKAELLRKQNEVKIAKATKITADEHVPKKGVDNNSKEKCNLEYAHKKKSKNKKSPETVANKEADNKEPKVYELEDSAQLEKSRRVLEAKSKYYERMTRTGGNLNSDDNCLVLFNRKRQEEDDTPGQQTPRAVVSSSESENSDSEAETNARNQAYDSDESEYVEFIDCLGRTRQVLRSELDDIKKRDKELAESMPERLDQTKANWMIDTKGRSNNDNDNDDATIIGPIPTPSLCSAGLSTVSKLEEQRINWERKEQENFDKPDVHYQDVFFDEARMHGVGYYAFSTDEQERKEQQRELESARLKTLEAQARKNAMREQRDRIVVERIFAAKNRIRARSGLPALSREEFEREYNKPKENEIEKNKAERKAEKKAAKLERKKAKEEAAREEERQAHVRPWDKVKLSGAARAQANTVESDEEQEEQEQPWKYKAERLPMSQEEWNEKQRAMRQAEFAPMPEKEPVLKRTNFSSMPPPATYTRTRAENLFDNNTDDKFTNYQSTKRGKTFERRNYNAMCDLDDDKDDDAGRRGAAIPPPANLDTAAPPIKRSKDNNELARSIDAGLRFLRDCSDKGKSGGKTSWAANAQY